MRWLIQAVILAMSSHSFAIENLFLVVRNEDTEQRAEACLIRPIIAKTKCHLSDEQAGELMANCVNASDDSVKEQVTKLVAERLVDGMYNPAAPDSLRLAIYRQQIYVNCSRIGLGMIDAN